MQGEAKNTLTSMNRDKYDKLLRRYKAWCKQNAVKYQEELADRHNYCKDMQQRLTPENIDALDEEGFYSLMEPLWALCMWGNKHYVVDNIVEKNGMEAIRREFKKLLYGGEEMAKRWDEFRRQIKGIGPAVMSEILNKFSPSEYILWNRKAETGFLLLEIEGVPRSSSLINGKVYADLCRKGVELVDYAQKHGAEEIDDLLTLDYFIWQEVQHEEAAPTEQPVIVPKTKEDSLFVHNDIRDIIKEIGLMLGFRADVEKKIADGAKVDAIWEVSVSNMGRITYVFEVQTKGSIDSLLLNLLKSKNNPSVQGVVAVSDAEQLEKIKKEASHVKGIEDLKFWDYNDVLKVYEHLSSAFTSINALALVPQGLF